MLEVRNLVKRYHGIAVVNDVTFELRRGDIVGYLGPNGSGKSTTIKMLTGLLKPSAGAILFNGRPIDEDPIGFRRRFGYVPEEPHLYPFMTGRGYLELIGGLREIDADLLDSRIPALLERVGLGEAGMQDISGYSKGMRQKLLICSALLHDPEVVILDEPDSGLDVTTTLVLRHLVRALADRGKAVLYSSHVLDIIEKVATKVIVLHRGRVVANDSVDRLRTLMSSPSLEDVFSQLAVRENPQQTAAGIVGVIGAPT